MRAKWFIIGGLALIGAYAAYYFYNQYQLIKDFHYKLKAYRFKRLTLRDVILEVDVTVCNDSKIDITITGYNVDTSVNNVGIGNLNSRLSQVIPAESCGVITVPIQFDPTKVFKQALNITSLNQIFNAKDQMIISFDGHLSLTISGVPVRNLPIDVKTSLADISKA